MIRILKLQKAVIASILGILALIAYKIMLEHKVEAANYVLSAAGILFMSGALMFLYPILFSKKDKEGQVELDPEKQEQMSVEEPPAQ